MTAAKIWLLFAVFCYFLFSNGHFVLRASSSDDLTCHILTHISISILADVTAPQTMPRTANMCGNIRFCFALLNDHGDRTNQLHWLECLHTLYISLLNPAGKGRLFYSVNKCFETGADPCNIFDKQILKGWMPCLSTFYCMTSRVTLA